MPAARRHTPDMDPQVEPAALLADLRDELGYRRIAQGYRTLERARPIIERLEPKPGSGVLVGLIAQWVDAGFDSPALLSGLLEKFPKTVRSALPLLDYLHLRMAEGVLAMADEDFERAAGEFLLVQRFEAEIEDRELLAIANFWRLPISGPPAACAKWAATTTPCSSPSAAKNWRSSAATGRWRPSCRPPEAGSSSRRGSCTKRSSCCTAPRKPSTARTTSCIPATSRPRTPPSSADT